MSRSKIKITRGLPGSGKTTFVSKLEGPNCIIRADYFRMQNGKYVFRDEDNKKIHNKCLRKFVATLYQQNYLKEAEHYKHIVVDNTNIRLWEISPYYRLAEAFDYEVEILWFQACPLACYERGLHGVSLEKILSMSDSFDALPSWWNVTVVNGFSKGE